MVTFRATFYLVQSWSRSVTADEFGKRFIEFGVRQNSDLKTKANHAPR